MLYVSVNRNILYKLLWQKVTVLCFTNWLMHCMRISNALMCCIVTIYMIMSYLFWTKSLCFGSSTYYTNHMYTRFIIYSKSWYFVKRLFRYYEIYHSLWQKVTVLHLTNLLCNCMQKFTVADWYISGPTQLIIFLKGWNFV